MVHSDEGARMRARSWFWDAGPRATAFRGVDIFAAVSIPRQGDGPPAPVCGLPPWKGSGPRSPLCFAPPDLAKEASPNSGQDEHRIPFALRALAERYPRSLDRWACARGVYAAARLPGQTVQSSAPGLAVTGLPMIPARPCPV